MDKIEIKEQCEIVVLFKNGDKFECYDRINIKDIEDILNDRIIPIKCVPVDYFINIINKLIKPSNRYNDMLKYSCKIILSFDKYVIQMDEGIPTGSINNNVVNISVTNVLIKENDFISKRMYEIERVVNDTEVELCGYVIGKPNEIIYKINPIKR